MTSNKISWTFWRPIQISTLIIPFFSIQHSYDWLHLYNFKEITKGVNIWMQNTNIMLIWFCDCFGGHSKPILIIPLLSYKIVFTFNNLSFIHTTPWTSLQFDWWEIQIKNSQYLSNIFAYLFIWYNLYHQEFFNFKSSDVAKTIPQKSFMDKYRSMKKIEMTKSGIQGL